MKYTGTEITLENKEYITNSPTFECALQCVESGLEPKDINAIRVKLIRQNEPFLLCISSTDTSSFNTVVKHKTGKVGRPKIEHKGKKVDTHFHLIIPCESMKQADDVKKELLKYLKKRRAKHTNMKRPQSSFITSTSEFASYISYSTGQADNIFTSGEFDFEYFMKQPYFFQ